MITRKVKGSNKNKINTRKNYRDKLIRLYPKCEHDRGMVDSNKYKNDAITYGEMTYNGIENLYKYINKKYKKNNISVFLDVGSGRGKLCMYMGSYKNIKKSIGIELVEERHKSAIKLLKKMPKRYSKNVSLLNKNILDIDLSKMISEPVLIWWSNLCFNSNKIQEIYDKIKAEVPKKSLLCCSKEINGIEVVNKINIPMSWSSVSSVLIYEL